ncbi:MAG: NAD(P)-dependent oxidoreductase, partial [Deinococcales bacterium]
KVIVYDPHVNPERIEKAGYETVSLDELYRRSDFITVHVPKLKDTLGMIDKAAFDRMKDGVMLVNCARGGIVNEADLYDAMVAGKVAGAALDVFEVEPPEGSPLLKLDRVICTPHQGASTREAQANVAVAVVKQIVDYLKFGTVVNAVMWRWIYNPEYGALNALLTQLHILPAYRSWLGAPGIAMNMIVAADVWKNFTLVALLVLAALQTIPVELHDAARVDGAGGVQRFRYITLPGIRPALLVALVLRTVEALKVFDIIYVMTRGGPASSTKTLSFLVYEEAFSFLQLGSAAAYAFLTVALILVFVAVYIRLLQSRGVAG